MDSLKHTALLGYDQGIQEFLQKPVSLASGTISTEVANTILQTITLPDALLANAMVLSKVKGYLGLRGTIVLRVQINCYPFQAGRLLLHYLPQAQLTRMLKTERNRSLRSKTQQPNVQLDFSCSSEATLEIPYTSPTPYYSLVSDALNGEIPYGEAYLTVYSPLRTGTGSATCTYTIWGYFKDVELVTPTYYTESGRFKNTRGKSIRGTPGEIEAAENGVKPISSALTFATTTLETLAKIPLLSTIATPASWVSGVARDVALFFGYSKPLNRSDVKRVTYTSGMYGTNADGIDVSQMMSISMNNSVSMIPGLSGTDLDEASSVFFTGVPAYRGTYNWFAAEGAGTVTMTLYHEPHAAGWTSSMSGAMTYYDATPMSYYAAQFEYWRGSFIVNIKAVKTKYHSGRLLFTYSPGHTSAPSLTETEYVLREVLDLEDSYEWSFVVPYASVIPWRKVAPRTVTEGSASDPAGVINLMVLNPLIAPDTVSSQIEIIVEVAGGPDFECAVPRVHDMMPCAFSTESGEFCSTKATSVSSTNQIDMAPCEFSIGEKITSIYQLLKRMTRVSFNGYLSNVDHVTWKPGQIAIIDISGAVFGTKDNNPMQDAYSFFLPCYAYSRGSLRVKMFSPQDTSSLGYRVIYGQDYTANVFDAFGVWQPFSANGWSGATQSYCVSTQNSFVEVQLPNYAQAMCRLNRVTFGAITPQFYDHTGTIQINATAAAVPPEIYRGVGDDFQLAFFVGVPRIGAIDIGP